MFLGAVIDRGNESLVVVTELLESSLHGLLYGRGDDKGLTKGEWLHVCTQICSGLNYLHLSDPLVVHRDVKPKNVLVSWPAVKIADFGISITNTEEIIGLFGTVPYMAPELLRSEPCNEKVDVYSFGVVAYEAMARNKPLANELPLRKWSLRSFFSAPAAGRH